MRPLMQKYFSYLLFLGAILFLIFGIFQLASPSQKTENLNPDFSNFSNKPTKTKVDKIESLVLTFKPNANSDTEYIYYLISSQDNIFLLESAPSSPIRAGDEIIINNNVSNAYSRNKSTINSLALDVSQKSSDFSLSEREIQSLKVARQQTQLSIFITKNWGLLVSLIMGLLGLANYSVIKNKEAIKKKKSLEV